MIKDLLSIEKEINRCTKCKLDGHVCHLIVGENPTVVLVGDAPKADDLDKLMPFGDKAHLILRRILGELGIKEYVLLNVLKCRPVADQAPNKDQMINCKGFLKAQIEAIAPKLVIALGNTASKQLKDLNIPHEKVFHPNYMSHVNYSIDRYRSDLVQALTILLDKAPQIIERVPQLPQLHCHSDFSVGDSIRNPEEMAEMAANLGITHLALTDHGTMAGVYQFEKACKAHGVQSIIGCEAYVKESSDTNRATITVSPIAHIADDKKGDKVKPYWQVNIAYGSLHTTLKLAYCHECTAEESIQFVPEAFEKWLSGGKTAKAPRMIEKLKQEGFEEFDYIITGDQSEGLGKGHMCIWVANEEGWKNLIHLHNDAVANHFNRKPLIPLAHLIEHSNGLRFGTACRGGLLFQKWIESPDEAEEWFLSLREAIVKNGGDIVIEIMPHPQLDLQHDFNQWAYDLGLKEDVPVIVTCDSHYIMQEDRIGKVAATSIAYRDRDLGLKPDYFPGNSYYYQNQEEVINNLGLLEEHTMKVIESTKAFAAQFNFKLPREFASPKGCVAHLNFRDIIDSRFAAFLKSTPPEELALMGGEEALRARIEMEYNRIQKSDFAWYFLIEYELCQRLDKAGILRGPGRGSASGSFISYIMDITRVNPITMKLLFERFLPEGRKDPPDFDLDVQKSRRQEAIDILADIVGRQTAQIATYARWHDKLKIRDICWLKKVSQEQYEAEQLPDEVNWDIRALCDILDGHIRHKGIHAAGVIALPDIMNTIPLTRVKKEGGNLAIELELRDILDLNIPKFDVLGLETLDYIAGMLRVEGEDLPNRFKALDASLHDLSDNDISLLLEYAQHFPYGIFQLGTQAGEQLMRDVPPEYFEDVVRIVALNRPGTRPLIDLYRKRRLEGEAYEAMVGTEDSYGLIIYQEQVLSALNIIFGMSMQDADQARRAISKKNLDKLQALEEGDLLKEQLKDPAKKKQWEEILLWAGYGFNRSHAVAYAWISLMTIYLKIMNPALAFTVWLNIVTEGKERREILREAKRMGIEIKRPHVKNLTLNAAVAGDAIQLGVTSIKGIGGKSGQAFIDKINSGKKMTLAKQQLLESVGSFDNRPVLLSDMDLIPLPEYKTIQTIKLADMEDGSFQKAEVMVEFTPSGILIDDGSGVFRAKTQIKGLEEGFNRLLIFKGAYWYYLLEVLQTPVSPDGKTVGDQWVISPVPAMQWKIGWIEGAIRSKKLNDYFRLIIYNQYEAHECICMVMGSKANPDDYLVIESKLKKLKHGSLTPGRFSRADSGMCFFHFDRDEEYTPERAVEIFRAINGQKKAKWSKFDMPLEYNLDD